MYIFINFPAIIVKIKIKINIPKLKLYHLHCIIQPLFNLHKFL